VLARDDGLSLVKAQVAAVARTVLFRRVRSVLIRAHGDGLIAHTLNFDYEVRRPRKRSANIEAFAQLRFNVLEIKRLVDSGLGFRRDGFTAAA